MAGGIIEDIMQDILILLIAIKQLIKQYHWQANSYQEHILADKLEEDLEDYIDEVAEVSVVMELSEKQLNADVLLGKASLYLQDKKEATELNLTKAFGDLSEAVHELSEKSTNIGLNDLLGRIANLTIKKIYLLNLK